MRAFLRYKLFNFNTMKNTVIGYPFVNHVDQAQRPQIKNAKEYIINCYSNKFHTCLNSLHTSGIVKIMGYKYDFKPYLKKFLYKQYGQWNEVYAPNKTLLRKSIYGRIDKIVEL